MHRPSRARTERRDSASPAEYRRLRLPHHIRPGARALFVGINPGVRSALTGHHFAGFSNRFWRLLHESGLVKRRLVHEDDVLLPEFGYGITNLVARPTPGIDGLTPADYAGGRRALVARIGRFRPGLVVLVGVTLYRALFGRPSGPFRLGPQRERLAGAPVYVVPNPSGRNANLSYADMLRAWRRLRRHLEGTETPPDEAEARREVEHSVDTSAKRPVYSRVRESDRHRRPRGRQSGLST